MMKGDQVMTDLDILECFKVRESDNIYCYAVDESFRLAVVRARESINYDYETSFNDLPESVKEIIKRLEGESH